MKNFFITALLFALPEMEEESEFSEAIASRGSRVSRESSKRIRSSYVDDITDQDLLILAIKGMLAELDLYSVYLDKEATKISKNQPQEIMVVLVLK